MTEQRLGQLMAEASEHLGAPELTETAWRRANGVRRRRRAIAASAAVVAATAVAVGVVSAPRGSDPAPQPTAGTPTAGPATSVMRIPELVEYREGMLPLPRRMAVDPATVAKLSAHPIDRAVAVFQPDYDQETSPVPGPIYALAADGTWVELDGLRLEYTHDEGGNKATPMRPTALSPDGHMVAFPQPDKLVVVELDVSKVTTIPVSGLNEHVVWGPDGRSLTVGGDGPVYEVSHDPATGAFGAPRPVPYSPWDLVVLDPNRNQPLELGGGGVAVENGPLVPLRLRLWSANGSPRDRGIDQSALGSWSVVEWYGRGWLHRGAIARSGWLHGSSMSGNEGISVMSVTADGDAAFTHLLWFGMGEWKGCCETLGWLDDHTVLIRAQRLGVIAWNITTGTVVRATDPFLGRVSLADLSRA